MKGTLLPADYARAAAALGCDVATVQAVAEVETARGGFLPDGRPDILYEAHVFHRVTAGRHAAALDRSGVPLSVPRWNRSLYGAAGAHQWERHDDAARLDPDAAVMACSWGAFQVLGENWRMCGYASPQAMAGFMREGIAEQLDAFIAYVRAVPGLRQAIQQHDWPTVARLDNGPGAVAEYGAKLATAYARLAPPAVRPAVPVHAIGDPSPPQPPARQEDARGNG